MFTFIGPSGVGKGTLINMYLQSNDDYELVPSHTTRAPRGSEVNGVHYHFITEQEFRKGIAEDKFIGMWNVLEKKQMSFCYPFSCFGYANRDSHFF